MTDFMAMKADSGEMQLVGTIELRQLQEAVRNLVEERDKLKSENQYLTTAIEALSAKPKTFDELLIENMEARIQSFMGSNFVEKMIGEAVEQYLNSEDFEGKVKGAVGNTNIERIVEEQVEEVLNSLTISFKGR